MMFKKSKKREKNSIVKVIFLCSLKKCWVLQYYFENYTISDRYPIRFIALYCNQYYECACKKFIIIL